jgi:iron-sulfur cluster repair protein YtfE (RIC family)
MATSDTTTRRMTVNAAFLRDIKDDNRDLKILMDRICLLAQHPQTATNHWPELIELFSDLCDQLALHFSLEEAYGYFDDAVVSAPQLSETAESLRGQHPKLFVRIRELADKALEVSADRAEHISRFLQRFEQFRLDFEKHEEDELKLILDALDNDIGVGD